MTKNAKKAIFSDPLNEIPKHSRTFFFFFILLAAKISIAHAWETLVINYATAKSKTS